MEKKDLKYVIIGILCAIGIVYVSYFTPIKPVAIYTISFSDDHHTTADEATFTVSDTSLQVGNSFIKNVGVITDKEIHSRPSSANMGLRVLCIMLLVLNIFMWFARRMS